MQDQIGRYEIRRELGRGGMATVFLAFDPRFRRQIAIKILPRQFTHDPRYLTLFEQEAQTIATLEHPAIVPVYDFGEHEDAPYLVMRYMSGGSLRDRLTGKPVPLDEIAAAIDRLAPALDYAHELGIIHRDLKPANVLFDHERRPYLADFGIARLAEASQTMTLVGTPAYMSPEQIEGKVKLDGRSDIYALGVMLFELLTGKQPYESETPTGQMFAHVHEPLPDVLEANQQLPPQAQSVIDKAMAKDREDRYATAAELAAAINELAAADAEEVGEAPAAVIPAAAKVLGAAADEPQELDVPEPAADEGDELVPEQQEEREVESLLEDEPDDEAQQEAAAPESAPELLDEHEEALPLLDETVAEAPQEVGDVVPVPPVTPSGNEVVESGGVPGWLKWAAVLALLVIVLSGIGYIISRSGQAEPTTDFKVDSEKPGSYLDLALAGEFAGTTVTIVGATADEEDAFFNESVAALSKATGINIQYSSNRDLESEIYDAFTAGKAPDIVSFPQPGLAAEYAAKGALVDVNSFMPPEVLGERYNQSWLDMATMPGADGKPIMAGVWHRFAGKSFVWYRKQAFEERGYEIPANWNELIDLTQRISAEGDSAWCIGIESGVATGWIATDWTEDLLLRTAPLEEYDAWVAGDLPFDSARVRTVIELWSEIWFNPEFAYGGREFIVNSSFFDAIMPMFDDPPSCLLHKQGSFLTGLLPEGLEYGRDYGVFYFPAHDEDLGRPMLISGDMMGMFNERDEVRAVMEYFTTPESTLAWTQKGTAFSPHLQAGPDMYGTELARDLAAIVEEATSFRFDGSDQMPGEVGTGSFWHMMTEYVAGAVDLDTAMREIDDSWPR